MSERSAEDVRREIATERDALAADLDVLRGQARSLVPFVVGGAVALILLSQGKHLKSGVKLLWQMR